MNAEDLQNAIEALEEAINHIEYAVDLTGRRDLRNLSGDLKKSLADLESQADEAE